MRIKGFDVEVFLPDLFGVRATRQGRARHILPGLQRLVACAEPDDFRCYTGVGHFVHAPAGLCKRPCQIHLLRLLGVPAR